METVLSIVGSGTLVNKTGNRLRQCVTMETAPSIVGYSAPVKKPQELVISGSRGLRVVLI